MKGIQELRRGDVFYRIIGGDIVNGKGILLSVRGYGLKVNTVVKKEGLVYSVRCCILETYKNGEFKKITNKVLVTIRSDEKLSIYLKSRRNYIHSIGILVNELVHSLLTEKRQITEELNKENKKVNKNTSSHEY